MALLDYPIPVLDVTLQEATRVLQLTLDPQLYSQYTSILSQQRGILEEAQTSLSAAASGRENWVTEQFKSRLLSCSDPLPTSTAIPSVLPSTKMTAGRSQAHRAAALMWAVAKLYSEPSLVEGDVPTERTQQSEVFSASRIPGSSQDLIQVYPDSLHAIIITTAGVFSVNVLERSVAGGQVSPLPFLHIYNQVLQVLIQPPAAQVNDPQVICSLSALQRQAWSSIREDILRRGGATAASLGVMESALVALSLEDCDPPAYLADTLNAVRLGGGDGSCLRYYDKVVNLVVFKDSTAGMVFEHSALDGMVAGLVAERVFCLSESVSLELNQANVVSSNGSTIVNSDSSNPNPLAFPMQGVTHPNLSPPLKATHPVLTFEVSSYPDVFSILQGHRGLYDAWINFSLQLSLRQTLGYSSTCHILVTPTHMRHYKHGRCDPTYSLSMKSRQLVGALASCVGPDNSPRYTTDLLRLFHAAFMEHKNLIKATKSGHGVGPHLAALRWALSPGNPLRRFLEPFGCPSVYLTGKDVMEGVECAVGNVYAKDQLAVTYLGRSDRVRMVLNGKGSFATILEKLQDSLKVTLKLVMLLAVRYAIADQMGALELLLQEGQADQTNDLAEEKIRQSCVLVGSNLGRKLSKQTQTPDPAAGNSRQDFTLVIHGGAGEEMMLNQKVVGVIEFALQTALTLGVRVLQGGGSSLDAVQTSVAALEDCFLFNAGKGSVFNREGKNEMEATIVDGSGRNSGSVACLQSVKNPIIAARHVMDKSAHSLLVGEGAEDFVQGVEGSTKPVKAEYFQTDVRRRELMAKLSGGNATKNNHPQTVGAVALDRHGKLAAATSTGGLVGKWKGRVGDTAVVGAGIYADDKLAVTCSGDGDVFLRHTVAQKVSSFYHHKGYSLRQACREVMSEELKGNCAGIIGVDAKGDAVVETNAGVMFVASMIDGITRVEVIRPIKTSCNVIWETDDLVAYLHSNPWTPGATILTRKTFSGQNSIFKLPLPDYLEMLQGAKAVASLLCERMDVQRCALVSYPQPDQNTQIRLLPLHCLETKWKPYLATEEDFQPYDPGYCSSKSGPRWEDQDLDQVQAKIQNKLPTPNAPSSYDYSGEPSDKSLFCRIVRGEEQHWRVWEDNHHVAFLTPYPNTPGLTVLVPRKPLTSDIFRLMDSDYTSLILAARKVASLLAEALGARDVALIFEGFEIDYAHAKLIPLVPSPGSQPPDLRQEHVTSYPGYVSSADGPPASPEALREIHTTISRCRPPRSWEDPQTHSALALRSQWYRNLFRIQNTLFHSTVEYFHNTCQYSYALTPLTTDTISSPMGLGSDSEPVFVNMLGQDVYLADSMQFVLEYFLRFQENLAGTYYVSPSFRGEDPDATHLNQFYHVECELLGDMDDAMNIAEGYVANLTKTMLKNHSDIIRNTAGTLSHAQDMLKKLDGKVPLPRITLDQAIPMMPSADCLDWVQDGQPQFGRKLTRKGERVLIEKYGGAVWLTEMDHLGVPFYQAYVEDSGRHKAKAADLLLGLGETVGLGERHSTPEMVQEALRHHAVPEESYKWYINMRQVLPLLTSGWGMGTERYLCWLLQHDDIRDIHIIPRMKTRKYMP